jgi:hypothetical protein
VSYEKGLLDSKEKCVKNCECIKESWTSSRIAFCKSLGDCGPKANWLGLNGFDDSYTLSIKKQ